MENMTETVSLIAPRRPHRSGRWSRLCLKELREILRDRRTLITLILMPLLVYPILSMVFQRSILSAWSGQKQRVLIGVRSEEIAKRLRRELLLGDMYLRREDAAALPSAKAPELDKEPPEQQESSEQKPNGQKPGARNSDKQSSPQSSQTADNPLGLPQFNPSLSVDEIAFSQHENLVAAVKSEVIDLAILTPRQSETGRFELIHREGSPASARALGFVEERFDAVNELNLRWRLERSGQSPSLAFRSERKGLKSPSTDNTLATIVPMILILMTVTGAVYPAIDLTAGERERGTLEMLMASPVPRLKLLLAKYVAVVAVAFLTALVNLTAMTITLSATGLSRVLFGEGGLGIVRVTQILGLLLLFAAFFSAVLLALTSFARSFKEAQAYLIPLMLLSLGPGIVSLLPGLKLAGVLAITPVSNMVLLARDLCGDGVNPVMASVAILSTALYTLAAIGIAAKIFGTDAVMSGGQGQLKHLFSGDGEDDGVSSVSGALLCLAILFPIYFVLSSFLGQLNGLPIWARLVVSGIATSLLFGAVPGVAASIQKLKFARAFGFHRTAAAAFTVALMLGFTLWPIAHEIIMFTQAMGLSAIRPEQLAGAQKLLDELRSVSPILILLAMAFAPAIFEELFFRGYLFSALRAASSRRTTILISALLFGLFHVISNGALSVERFLPSTFMGLVLGWLCYQSGSVWPGMLLHACHNGVLMMMAYYKDELAARGFGIEEQSHMPTSWIAVSVFAFVVGIVLIGVLPPRQSASSMTQTLTG